MNGDGAPVRVIGQFHADASLGRRGAVGRMLGFVVLISVGLGTAAVQGQLMFQEVGASRGLGAVTVGQGMGCGVSAVDYDADGFVDLFVPTGAGQPDQLYHNLGTGQFEEIAGTIGLASTDEHRAALWIDYDGDGRLDLFLTNDDLSAATAFELFRQKSDGTFEDVTVAAGLFLPQSVLGRGGNCAGDLNRDGYLDVVAAPWPGQLYLFMNNRDGTFSDKTVEAGLGMGGNFHQPVMADFNGDGWLDVYAAVDFGANRLYINQKDGTFVDMAVSAGADNSMNDMGVTLGDYDNDGDLDIYVTNIYYPDDVPPKYNILLRNDSAPGGLAFVEIAASMGVENGQWGWGTTFIDGDNDGWLDLAATNGWTNPAFANDTSRFFLNATVPAGPFVEVGASVGFDDTYFGSALVSVDYDRDGDLDLVQMTMPVESWPSSIRLLENSGAGSVGFGRYLVVQPRMDGPNHWAIGAICRITVNGTSMMRLITAGTSYLGQEPAEAFFGLASAQSVQTLSISWPDGTQTVLADVAVDQVLTVLHGGFGDLNADGAVALDDHVLLVGCLKGPGILAADACLPADVNADRAVDLGDCAVIQNRFTGP